MSDATTWGACGVCDRDVPLKKDGTLRRHSNAVSSLTCSGSGKPPAGPPRRRDS